MSNAHGFSEDLVAFLYILMRDEITPGTVAGIVKHQCLGHQIVEYTNKYLEAYAREIAIRLAIPKPLPDQASSYRHAVHTEVKDTSHSGWCNQHQIWGCMLPHGTEDSTCM